MKTEQLVFSLIQKTGVAWYQTHKPWFTIQVACSYILLNKDIPSKLFNQIVMTFPELFEPCIEKNLSLGFPDPVKQKPGCIA